MPSLSLRRSRQGPATQSAHVADSVPAERVFGPEGVPLVVMLALAIALGATEGGFADTHRYAASLFALAMFALLVAIRGVDAVRAGGRPLKLAVFSAVGFLAWSYLSIAWSDEKGIAFSGANRTLLYVLAFVVVVLSPVGVRVASHVILTFAFAVGLVVFTTSIQVSRALDPLEFLIGNRLSAPIGYPNGTAAFLMVATWTTFGLATRKWLNGVARALAFGATGALLLLAFLAQSRGSVFTTPFVALAFLILVPGRWRAILSAGLVAVVCGLAAPTVFSVFQSSTNSELSSRFGDSLGVIAASFALLVVAGACFVLVDRWIRVPEKVLRVASGALIVAVLGVALVGGIRVGVVDRADGWWADFTQSAEVNGDTSRFGGLGSNRYDFWRVGLNEFVAHPIEGIGVDNFLVPYLKARHSPEEPIYPHSLLVGLLSQTGLVGTALFALLIASTIWSLYVRPRGPARELAAVAVVGSFALLFHGFVDWLWEIPALGLIGFVFLGLAFAVQSPPVSIEARTPFKYRRAATAGFAIAIVLLGAILGSAWLSARYVARATSTVGIAADTAIAELDTASTLNPFADEPALLAATIAIHTGDLDVARNRLERAVDRNPSNWYSQLQLGAVAAAQGDEKAAGAAFERALTLNPGEPVACLAARRFESGSPLTPRAVERALGRDLSVSGCGVAGS